MAVADLGLVEFTVEGTNFGIPFVNVYHYQLVGGLGDINDLLYGFENQVVATIIQRTSSTCTFGRVTAKSLFYELDKAESTISLPGGRALSLDTGVDPMVAWGLRLIHDEPNVREGAKRLPGVDEGDMALGGNPQTAVTTALNAIALALLAGFDDPVTGYHLGLVVVGRILEPGLGYRLPATLQEALARGIGHVFNILIRGLTTQNSRKRLPPIA